MLDIIRGDLCSLGGTILILVLLGRIFADQQQKKWGAVLALIAFLSYGVWACFTDRPRNAPDLFNTTVTALVVFGLALGLSWNVLPLAFGVMRPVVRTIKESSEASRHEWQRLQAEWEAEDHRRQAAEEWARGAPERERQKQLAEDQAEEQARAQKRREDAKAPCIFLYEQQGHLVGARLPRERFDDLMTRFLGDTQPPEEVERRAIQLQNLVLGHAQQLDPLARKLPKQEIEDARAGASQYYNANKELLKEVYPPELFESFKRLHMAANLEPETCWLACHKLIGRLQKLVAQEREAKRKADARNKELAQERRGLETEIEECKQRIAQLRASGKQADAIEHEIMEETAQIRHLEKQLRVLDEQRRAKNA